MFQCMKHAAHCDHSKGVIFASMLAQPGGIFQHRKPPFVQDAQNCAADFVGGDEVDQRLGIRALDDNPKLSNDVPL